MPVRCAIYARYSSDQQRPESIEDQVRHCRQEAARHPDWVILEQHIYSDHAVTGANVEGRAGLARLTTAAKRIPRPFDKVLFDDTSRLARDAADTLSLLRDLRFRGIGFYFVNQALDSDRDNADFFVTIYGAVDAEYIRELGRKTHRGLEGQALKDFSAGGLAYGYRREVVADQQDIDRDGQARRRGVRWVADPVQAEVIQRIFTRYADGHGLARIAASLNADAVPSPRAAKAHRARRDGIGSGWDVSTVRTILGNEVYRGRLVWNRSRWVRDPVSRRRRRLPRDPSEHVVRDRPDLRLVSDDLWSRVQARRAKVRALIP